MFDTIVLDAPEMMLAADPIPGPVVAITYWLPGGRQTFTTYDALIQARTEVEHRLAVRIEPWQAHLPRPAWVRWVPTPDLPIYGWLPSPEQLSELERGEGAGPIETGSMLRRLLDATLRGWVWGRWYSRIVPDGEWGALHVSDIGEELTETEFNDACAAGWL